VRSRSEKRNVVSSVARSAVRSAVVENPPWSSWSRTGRRNVDPSKQTLTLGTKSPKRPRSDGTRTTIRMIAAKSAERRKIPKRTVTPSERSVAAINIAMMPHYTNTNVKVNVNVRTDPRMNDGTGRTRAITKMLSERRSAKESELVDQQI